MNSHTQNNKQRPCSFFRVLYFITGIFIHALAQALKQKSSYRLLSLSSLLLQIPVWAPLINSFQISPLLYCCSHNPSQGHHHFSSNYYNAPHWCPYSLSCYPPIFPHRVFPGIYGNINVTVVPFSQAHTPTKAFQWLPVPFKIKSKLFKWPQNSVWLILRQFSLHYNFVSWTIAKRKFWAIVSNRTLYPVSPY